MFGYKLVKEEKPVNENEGEKKPSKVKGALKTVGKTVAVGLAVGGAFFAGKGFDSFTKGKEEDPETEDEPVVGTDD